MTEPTQTQEQDGRERKEYPAGFCKRCASCKAARPISHFPDDPTQPDGISPWCDWCDSAKRAEMAKEANALPPVAPPPAEGEQPPVDLDAGQPPEDEPAEAGEPLNCGQVTAGARVVIDAEKLDLSLIRGRPEDNKVGVPEIHAWKGEQARAAEADKADNADAE